MNRNILKSIANKDNKISLLLICIPALVGILMIYNFTKSYELYHITIEVLCITLSFSLSMISFTKHGDHNSSIFNYIGISFLFVSVINIFHLMSMFIGFDNEMNRYYEILIWICTICLECLAVTFSYILNYKKLNFNKTSVFYIIISMLILTITSIMMYSDYDTKNFFKLIVTIVIAINIINMVILFLNKKSLRKKEYVLLLLYIFLMTINIFIFKSSVGSNVNMLIISHIIKYIDYYLLYVAVQEFTLKATYRKMKEDLIETKEKQSTINKTLNERNRMLKEFKSMISKSEKRYQELVESIADAILIFNKGKLTYYNKGIFSILGNKDKILFKDKKIGTLFKELTLDYREVRQELYIKDFNFVNSKNRLLELELFLFRIDRNIELMFIKDNTEFNFNNKLKEELTAYLKEENMKKQFFSNISHELRTPINLIYSAIQLNDININEKQIPSLDKNNDVIKQNCLRLIRTINNFIDANKISEGYLQANMNVYNIVDIVENVSQAAYKYIEKQGLEMIFDAEEEEIYAECDYIQLERIVLNLLSNSVKYGKNGTTVWINVLLEGDFVVISVRNDGYAIPESVKPYLFDKFTKINKALNREKEGSGLGLYLTKGLIELQNGKIKINSKENFGTEFKIYLHRWEDDIRYDNMPSGEMNDLEEKVDIEFSDIYI